MTETALTSNRERETGAADDACCDVSVDAVGREEWNLLIQDFADATLFQTWDYEAVRWGERRLGHVVLRRMGKAVAAAQVRVVRAPLLHCGIAYVYAGPLWRPRGVSPDFSVFSRIVRALHDEYVVKRGLVLRLVPNEVRTPDERPHEALMAAGGFHRVDGVKPYRTFMLDLSQAEDRLMGGIRSGSRNRLRSAMRKGLELEVGTSDGLFQEFLRVYDLMRQRKQFEEHIDVRDFREIQSRLPESFKMQVTVCRHEGEPIAASVCATVGCVGNLLLLATSEAALHLNASLLTIWRAISELKAGGTSYLDMGGVDPEENAGGYMFKGCFGGEEVFHIGTYEACDSPLSSAVTHGGEWMRRVARRLRAPLGRLPPVPARGAIEPSRPDDSEK